MGICGLNSQSYTTILWQNMMMKTKAITILLNPSLPPFGWEVETWLLTKVVKKMVKFGEQ